MIRAQVKATRVRPLGPQLVACAHCRSVSADRKDAVAHLGFDFCAACALETGIVRFTGTEAT